MENMVLLNHLLQHVSNASGEDQQRNLLLLQMVEKHFVTIPMEITHHNQDQRNRLVSLVYLNINVFNTTEMFLKNAKFSIYLSIDLDSLTA